MAKYDVIIVGAGPAGIFTALELVKKDKLSVLLLEQGPDLGKRLHLAEAEAVFSRRRPHSITSGWGGAGAFSDGKLTLSTEIGGWLSQYVSEDTLEELINYVDQVYLEFGGSSEEHGTNKDEIAALKRKAQLADLTLIPFRIRHLGTERCREILKNMREFLEDKLAIETETEVERILLEGGKVKGVLTKEGKEYLGSKVVVAPGRVGADWLALEAQRLGLNTYSTTVDIGVRVEVPALVMEPLTSILYEPKLIYYSSSFQDKIRTFCMNPYGEVTVEVHDDVITVNGHSYANVNQRTDNTNFALLVSTSFTEPFKEPIAYGKYIARLANLLGEGILVQRLGDLKAGRRSTDERIRRSTVKPTLSSATPGDLSFVLPYRYISDILEMIEALDKMARGVNSRNTLLYGVEVKFYSSRVKLSSTLETEIKNLYAAGDGAGITRGLIQSSCSGVIAARAILEKEESILKSKKGRKAV